jgi:prepilin-type N-terminal cleavage/methylation domain-containing protein
MCQAQRTVDGARAEARAGYTLIELLIAIAISGLLGVGVIGFLQRQQNITDFQSARQSVQQNARGAVELLSKELRAVPPGAIRTAEQNRIQFLLPRVWGVLCDTIPTTGSGNHWVLFPTGTFPADFPTTPSLAPDWGIAIPAANGSWSTSGISSVSTGTPTCNASFTVAAGGWEARRINYASLPGGVAVGTRVFLYQTITYEAGTDAGMGGDHVWLKRNIGSGSTEAIAGPLGPEATASSVGLVFGYTCRNKRLTIAPGNGGTTGFPLLTAVSIRVQMESERVAGTGRPIQSDSTVVQLRNASGGADCP